MMSTKAIAVCIYHHVMLSMICVCNGCKVECLVLGRDPPPRYCYVMYK